MNIYSYRGDYIRVAIPSKENTIESSVNDIFGRSPYFAIAEIENNRIKDVKIIENKFTQQSGGAGISAAKLLVENGVEAVIAENIGPRALDVFKQFNIKMYSGKGKIKIVLNDLVNKKLEAFG